MSTKEHVLNELENLTETDLEQVSRYIAFLKYQSRKEFAPHVKEDELAALYAEFAEEDRVLSEEGMKEYDDGLRNEDKR
jgi:hypothetical protein